MCQLDCNGDHRLFSVRIGDGDYQYHVGLSKMKDRYNVFANQLNAGEAVRLLLPVGSVQIERLA